MLSILSHGGDTSGNSAIESSRLGEGPRYTSEDAGVQATNCLRPGGSALAIKGAASRDRPIERAIDRQLSPWAVGAQQALTNSLARCKPQGHSPIEGSIQLSFKPGNEDLRSNNRVSEGVRSDHLAIA
ncbi:hypothetical protein FRC12_022607 [Ceratobasidium sp. 428]|nr:hypothetical protein FRC12_022607 [Ceratobasidium sp. 428]